MDAINIKKNYINKIIISALVIFFVIYFINIFRKEVRGFFYSISAPMQKYFWTAGNNIADFTASVTNARNIKRDYDKILSENNQLVSEISFLKEVKIENDVLRQALGLELQKEFNLQIASVISKDTLQDFILINKGQNSGIQKNMAVITAQKNVIGRVTEAYPNFSKVMLISDKNSFFDAKIQNKEIAGIVRGEGSFKVILDLIPRDRDIMSGDTVVTTNLGGIFSAGVLVGKISSIKKNDIDLFQSVEITPAFDINSLNYLFVITNEKTSAAADTK